MLDDHVRFVGRLVYGDSFVLIILELYCTNKSDGNKKNVRSWDLRWGRKSNYTGPTTRVRGG